MKCKQIISILIDTIRTRELGNQLAAYISSQIVVLIGKVMWSQEYRKGGQIHVR